jgi:hypothetical protein
MHVMRERISGCFKICLESFVDMFQKVIKVTMTNDSMMIVLTHHFFWTDCS